MYRRLRRVLAEASPELIHAWETHNNCRIQRRLTIDRWSKISLMAGSFTFLLAFFGIVIGIEYVAPVAMFPLGIVVISVTVRSFNWETLFKFDSDICRLTQALEDVTNQSWVVTTALEFLTRRARSVLNHQKAKNGLSTDVARTLEEAAQIIKHEMLDWAKLFSEFGLINYNPDQPSLKPYFDAARDLPEITAI